MSLVRLSANNLHPTPFLSKFFKVKSGNPTAVSYAVAPERTLVTKGNRTAKNANVVNQRPAEREQECNTQPKQLVLVIEL